jgi:hypothetical protein
MENIGYYIFLLVAIIVGITIIKRIASCMIKSLVLVVLLAILAYAYFFLL